METPDVSTLQWVLVGLIAVCCVTGVGLQFFAWRHLKPGIPKYGHKDALFNKKKEYYTDEGMRYVNMQRIVMYAMGFLFMAFLLLGE